jgi:hypothetical protein
VGKDGALGHPSLDTCTPGTGFCGGSSLPITRAHMGGTHPTAWQPLIGYHHWLVVSGRAKYGSDVRKIPLPPRPRPR